MRASPPLSHEESPRGDPQISPRLFAPVPNVDVAGPMNHQGGHDDVPDLPSHGHDAVQLNSQFQLQYEETIRLLDNGSKLEAASPDSSHLDAIVDETIPSASLNISVSPDDAPPASPCPPFSVAALKASAAAARRRVAGVWHWYEARLETFPLSTQMCTTAFLWGLGDFLAQLIGEGRRFAAVSPRRVVLTCDFGAVFVGPLGHFWLIFLDRMCRRFLSRLPKPVFFFSKAMIDVLIMGTLFVVAFYAWGSIIIDEEGFRGFARKLREGFLSTFAGEMVIWPLFQMLNFAKVPLHHQLLATNCMTLVDASFLSWARAQDDWFKNIRGRGGHQ